MKVIPKSWYSWDFSVMDGGRTIAVLDLSCWRERGEVVIQEVTHRVFREGAMSGDFVIEQGGRPLASASKPSAWRHTLIVHYNGKEYTVRKPSMWRRGFVLMDGERQIGSMSPESMWTRRATADLPSDWPMPIKAFVIWLVIILWKRDANNAAA
jgi:hypothetical protein